jgi:hypothetical protein
MRHHRNLSWLLILGGVCLLTTFLYRDTLSLYFLGDDLSFLYYVANGVREERALSQVFDELLSPPYRGGFFYRPLTVASFLGDYLLYGKNPTGWHLTNLLLHLFNVTLLWCLVVQVAGSRRSATIIAGAAAAIFAIRPSSPETVVWVSDRTDQLVLIGFLVALLAYLRAEGKWGRYYLLAVGGFLFALGSKEAGVTLPGGLLALHIAGAIPVRPGSEEPHRRAWFRHVLKGIGPFALILLIYFAWRFFLFGTPFKVLQEVMPIELTHPGWWAVKLHALRFLLSPTVKITALSESFLIATLIQILIGLVAALWWPAARRVWVFGGCWLMAVLLSMAPQFFIAPTGEGARLLYIPGAALAVLLAAPLASCSEPSGSGKVLGRTLCVAGVIGMALLFFLSVPLLKDLLRPWLEAGQSMKRLVVAIAARADAVPEGGFAVLLVPDHFDGALFARNGQGALMEPPVQRHSLSDRIIVLTPPTAGAHAPRLASSRQSLKLEHWCWDLEGRHFKQLRLREHSPDQWLDAWKSALRDSGCRKLADELEMLYR